MKLIKSNIYLFILILFCFVLFSPFTLQGKIPLPADSLVGMYHPFRDSLKDNYPNGYPYKNSLITDPVRQQYPYRFLAVDLIKNKQLPKWNPYSFAGTPLLANIQSAVLYPLNFLFFILNFNTAWSIQILLQPLLAGIFMYFYLKSLKLNPPACFLGSVAFAFSGFMVVWMEWNTVGQALLWLPIIILAIDKLVSIFSFRWLFILIFSLISSFLAGHIQITFYVWVFSFIYFITRLVMSLQGVQRRGKLLGINWIYIFIMTIFIILFFFQFFPALNFILSSARNFDLADWHRADWFIPWQHLLQFISPDFFGNPVTQNYWGIWNYGEFVGYIGLIPLVFAVLAMVFRKDKKTLFFGTGLFIGLFLSLPTFLGKIPYQLKLPFISTMQPSRMISIIIFCLVILGALGLDYFIKQLKQNKKLAIKSLLTICILFSLIFLIVWLGLIFSPELFTDQIFLSNLKIAQKNMILPTVALVILWSYLLVIVIIKKPKTLILATGVLLLVTAIDLLRFSQKFIPFVQQSLVFPQTKTLEFLKNNLGNYRYMTTDRRILPPNVSAFYKLATVDGYDPLYLKNYAQLAAAWTRSSPDIKPAQFGRIITPENYNLFLTDLLGVKYVVSLKEEKSAKLKLVFTEEETRVYENTKVFPRAFLVEKIEQLPDPEKVISAMFDNQKQLDKIAYTDSPVYLKSITLDPVETVEITKYTENKITLKANTLHIRLLVLSDIFYSEWKVIVNGKPSSIFPVDFCLRGVMIPQGESVIELSI